MTEDRGLEGRIAAALSGRYEIVRAAGQGGMATVFLARDLKHGRDVALKVLRPELAAVVGAERFLSEIKTTANLTHPHILPLHDSGEADGLLYYVTPFVEGETLRDRIERERQLPVAEALRIATDVAAALQHAHERGVVHRDVKPANILLQDGEPVVADFGIALAVGAGGSERLTETGLSLGTPYYMSPEQATGDQEVGPRSDVYSLAAVLYEMLTGEPPYPGTTAQAVLGRIIAGVPASATAHRASVPAHVDAAIRKALEKLPADRFGSTDAFARALADPGFRHGPAGGGEGDGTRSRSTGRTLGVAAAAVVAALALGVAVGRGMGSGDATGAGSEVVRYDIPVDPNGRAWLGSMEAIAISGRPIHRDLAISPDGTTLVYGASFVSLEDSIGTSSLLLRRLDRRSVEVLESERTNPETQSPLDRLDTPRYPFFSPDGTQIGYVHAGAIRRRSLVDGEIVTVYGGELDISARAGFAWTDAGEILFISEGRLMRVPESGGEPTAVELDLPEGRRPAHPAPVYGTSLVLFSSLDFSDGGFAGEVRAMDLDSGEHWAVVDDAMDPVFVEDGYLVFMRSGTLMAVGFDADGGRAIGTPVAVVDSVMHSLRSPNTAGDTGTGQYALSRNGHLVYAIGGLHPLDVRHVVRRTVAGAVDTLGIEPGPWAGLRVDPTGRRLALTREVPGTRLVQLYLHDLERGITQPLGDVRARTPWIAWSPDGTELAYQVAEGGPGRMSLQGVGAPVAVSPESRCVVVDWVAAGEIVCRSDANVVAVNPETGEVTTVLDLPSSVLFPTVSPDGRWLAYVTTETGAMEVYVAPYRRAGPSWRVSIDGGITPVWSPDGERIHFRGDPDPTEFWSAEVVENGERFSTAPPERWFGGWARGESVPLRWFDLGPDGTLFSPRTELVALDHWTVDRIQVYRSFAADLERRLGGGGA